MVDFPLAMPPVRPILLCEFTQQFHTLRNLKSCLWHFSITLVFGQVIISYSRGFLSRRVESSCFKDSSKLSRFFQNIIKVSRMMLQRYIWNKSIQARFLLKSCLPIYGWFWCLSFQIQGDLANTVITNSWILMIIGFVE